MSPWKTIIEQVESGYSVYRAYLIWQHSRKCPHKLTNTGFGRGVSLADGEWYDSPRTANKFAEKWKQQWHKDNPNF